MKTHLEACFCCVTLLVGCGSDPAPNTSTDREGPLYVVSNTLLIPDSVTSYVTVVDSLDAGADVDPAKFLELPGSSRLYGLEGSNVLYATSSEDATMTEITVAADGTARQGRSISFANLGINTTSGGNVLLHLSPSKAYFASQDSAEVVVWDPSAMEIVKTLPLELELDAKYPYPYFYPRPIVVDQRLVLVSNNSSDELSGPGVTVSVIDTNTDEIESTTIETRCHSFLQSAVDAHGDRYFASSDIAGAEHLLNPDLVPAPCMLRLRAGETSFDADWSRTLSDELRTELWTGVTQGAKGRVYVQAIDDDAPAVVDASKEGAYEVTAVPAWDWYSLKDGEATPVASDTGLVSPPIFAPFTVDGDDYVSVWDDVDTTLVNLTAASRPRPGLVVPGFVYNVVRIR